MDDLEELRGLRSDLRNLRGEMRTLNENMKYVKALARQMYLFNQIMMQTSKMSGASAMLASVVEGFAQMARRRKSGPRPFGG